MTSFRFDTGGLIDRSTVVDFSFDGMALHGLAVPATRWPRRSWPTASC